jgi:methyl-accepting chemotaxis protein
LSESAEQVSSRTDAQSQSTQLISGVVASLTENIAGMAASTRRSAEMVQQTAATMLDIKAGTDAITDEFTVISAALESQAERSRQVSAQVEEIARVSSDNNRAIREVARTANTLSGLASEQHRAVAQFHL